MTHSFPTRRSSDLLWIGEPDAQTPPPGMRLVREAMLAQMAADDIPGDAAAADIVTLTDEDAEEMRALALMTRPGPFLPLTHRLGRFIGIREQGRLIAMAGERMGMPGFGEDRKRGGSGKGGAG